DAAAQREDVEHVIVHTGQHYDAAMSDVFFADLRIPAPDVNLAVGSGSHGRQTGAMLAGMDEVLEEHRPDWTLVYGDTNSTLAGTLSAVKMHLQVAHLEAGLRSFNRRMPEEHNRVLTDHAADLLLAPTEVAREHLAAEGLAERTVVTGDVMTDVPLRVWPRSSRPCRGSRSRWPCSPTRGWSPRRRTPASSSPAAPSTWASPSPIPSWWAPCSTPRPWSPTPGVCRRRPTSWAPPAP